MYSPLAESYLYLFSILIKLQNSSILDFLGLVDLIFSLAYSEHFKSLSMMLYLVTIDYNELTIER